MANPRSTIAVKAMLKMDCWKSLLNDQDEEGYTPLMLACRIKGNRVHCYLLRYVVAELTKKSHSGLTIEKHRSILGNRNNLHFVRYQSNLRSPPGSKVAETLLDHGARPDIMTSQGQSVVHYCSIAGDISFLRYIANKIDLRRYCRLQAAGGVEPLHLASQHGNSGLDFYF